MADRREYYKQYYKENRERIRGAYRDTHPKKEKSMLTNVPPLLTVSKSSRPSITQEYLHKIMSYNTETGDVTFKIKSSICMYHGYMQISIDKTNWFIHILVWIYVYGVYPHKYVDHINGNKQDNRICNLRLVNKRENALNKKYHRAGRLPGVGRTKVGYTVTIQLYGGYKAYLGFYKDERYASAVYIKYLLIHNLVSQEFIDSMGFNLPDLSTVDIPDVRIKFYQDSSRKEREYLGDLSEDQLLVLARRNSEGRF